MRTALIGLFTACTAASNAVDAAQPASSCIDVSTDSWGPDGTVPVRAETVVSGLEVPWSFAFLPAGDVLISERPGRVRLLRGGSLVQEPVLTVASASQTSEGGLLGIAVDPKDATRLYLYVTVSGPHNELQRWRLSNDHAHATFEAVVTADIAAARFHDGGRIRFGPDGMLYVGTGDAAMRNRAQKPKSLNGKLLRLTPQGSVEVFALGIRNTEGFDWIDRDTVLLVDHGPSGEMGVYANDEVNLVHQGDNLGWPVIHGCERKSGMVTPIITWSRNALPPGGVAIYRGSAIPQWKGSAIVASLASEHLHRIVVENGAVKLHEVYFRQQLGRLREIAMTPAGELWVSTSNCDGRGECPPEKDRIVRIVPK